MQFVADLKFRGNDVECERLYNEYKKARANLQSYLMGEGIDFGLELEREKSMEEKRKWENWISIALPENCTNVCVFLKKEVAELHIKKYGASPLYGFDEEDWLPVKVFITHGGSLAPDRKYPEN